MKSTSKARVLKLISDQLRKAHVGDISFTLVADELEKRNGTWYVPVLPTAQPPSMYQYYEALSDVETELSEKHDLHVWLVPALPD